MAFAPATSAPTPPAAATAAALAAFAVAAAFATAVGLRRLFVVGAFVDLFDLRFDVRGMRGGLAFACLGLGFLLDLLGEFRLFVLVQRRRIGCGLREQDLGLLDGHHLFAAIDGEADLAADLLVGVDGEHDLESLLEPAQMRALVVEHIERDLGPRADDEIVGRALEQHLLDRAQKLQRDR